MLASIFISGQLKVRNPPCFLVFLPWIMKAFIPLPSFFCCCTDTGSAVGMPFALAQTWSSSLSLRGEVPVFLLASALVDRRLCCLLAFQSLDGNAVCLPPACGIFFFFKGNPRCVGGRCRHQLCPDTQLGSSQEVQPETTMLGHVAGSTCPPPTVEMLPQ